MIYVCSPYSGDIAKNVEYAKRCCLQVIKDTNDMPIAPHLYFTQFLDDDNIDNRALGMSYGMQLLKLCSEVWVFGDYLSQGMVAEIAFAQVVGVPVRYVG